MHRAPIVGLPGVKFLIENAPIGKHTLEVWHPLYEPVRKTVDVEIKKDETTEIVVKFKTPDFLKEQKK